jgi:hypothetical protein
MGVAVLRERDSIPARGMTGAARLCRPAKNDRVNVQNMECRGDWSPSGQSRRGSKMNPPGPGDPLESVTVARVNSFGAQFPAF